MKRFRYVGILLGLGLLILLAAKWPFARDQILQRLGDSFSSEVSCSRFRLEFFPHPGCVLEDVVVSRASTRLATARRMTLKGSWLNVLTLRRRLKIMDAEGLVVTLPWPVPEPVQRRDRGGRPSAAVDVARFDGAVLEVAGRRFEFRELRFGNLGWKERVMLRASFRHPEPPGDLHLSGLMGPWSNGDTPVEGQYELTGADLGKYRGIAGTLTSKGTVKGTLGAMAVAGTAGAEDFQVTSSGHSQPLQTTFDALVNGMTGDVALRAVEARFGRSILRSSGTVSDGTAVLDFVSRQAHVEDLLYMFTKSDRPAMRGPLGLEAHVELPPGEAKFLERVRIDGDFSVRRAHFNKPITQARLNRLSARARNDGKEAEEDATGEPEEAMSDLKAHVVMRKGLARLSAIGFRLPGAAATGGGTYNLLSKRVDLRGEVKMEATVSQAAGGFRGVVLKPFNFLFRRKSSPAGAILPVSVTGTYPRPRFQVGLKPVAD